MTRAEPRILALVCEPQGMIAQVLRNDWHLAAVAPGRLFPRIVDAASRVKALNFLEALRADAAAFDWTLNFSIKQAAVPLHFSGGRMGEQLLIIGAADGRVARRTFQELLSVNNAQANLLRAALKETNRAGADADSLDQITRLNNELVSIQRELAKKNAELERLNELKNQFLGMAAHDLRSPLGAIQSFSELLLESHAVLDAAEQKEFLNEIRALSQFMRQLVDDLLSVSAIEAGRLDLDLRRTDLPALVRKNVARNRLLAARKQIEIALETEDVPPLALDAPKIEQALDNLIGNAVKFSPPGATARVRLRHTDAGAQIAIQDQGPGISPADMEKLFQPFGRAATKATGGEPSTGLGLAIVKRIVEGHRGKIWLESAEGKGSTFFIQLPSTLEEKEQ